MINKFFHSPAWQFIPMAAGLVLVAVFAVVLLFVFNPNNVTKPNEDTTTADSDAQTQSDVDESAPEVQAPKSGVHDLADDTVDEYDSEQDETQVGYIPPPVPPGDYVIDDIDETWVDDETDETTEPRLYEHTNIPNWRIVVDDGAKEVRFYFTPAVVQGNYDESNTCIYVEYRGLQFDSGFVTNPEIVYNTFSGNGTTNTAERVFLYSFVTDNSYPAGTLIFTKTFSGEGKNLRFSDIQEPEYYDLIQVKVYDTEVTVDCKVPITDDDIAALIKSGKIPSYVREISITARSGRGTSTLTFESLSTLKDLRVIKVSNFIVDDASVLAKFPKLECLNVFRGEVTDSAIVNIGRATTLLRLELQYTIVDDALLDELARNNPNCEVYEAETDDW
ncbi:MAG: hypothetical protein FWG45_03995 [Oscillospiraceae bacterium]|nr:hypothetical protein [Oscillospiraceae bacterium]